MREPSLPLGLPESPMPLPGGGAYGRSAKREVKNPALALPSARAIQSLPIEQRRPLGILLRELAFEAREEADRCWHGGKGMMAAYWRVVSVYAKHLACVIEPRSPGSFIGREVSHD